MRILFASGRVVHDDLELADEALAELGRPVDVVKDVSVQVRNRISRFDGREKSREITFDCSVDDVAGRRILVELKKILLFILHLLIVSNYDDANMVLS